MSQASLDTTGMNSGTLTAYITGLILALILTVIPFAIVMNGVFSVEARLFVIFGAGLVQIVVHFYYFLHLDTSSTARWNMAALLLTILILILFVGGSLWIIWTLRYRMM